MSVCTVKMTENYNFSWETFSDHLPNMLREMMTEEAFTDVTLICEDKKNIKAHRNILAACSPVFKNMFETSNDANHPIVFLKGIKSSEMESILQFIYLGETTFNQERLKDFLEASKCLEIPELGNDQNNDQDINLEPDINLTFTTPDVQHDGTGQIKTEPGDPQPNGTEKVENEHKDPLSGKNNMEVKREHQCDECSKVFRSKGHLKRHKESIHWGVRYYCQSCNTGFSQPGNITRHTSTGKCSKA